MEYSVNHHFIPIFFQFGFCNEEKLIYVYDKKLDKVFPPSIPDRRFYKKNLNNFIHENKIVSSTERTIYGSIDSKGSLALKRILENKSSIDDSSPFDKIDLLYFMLNLVWRTPTSDELLNFLIREEGLCNKYFGIYNEITGQRYSDDDESVQEIKNKIFNDPEFAKHFKILVALSDSSKKEIIRLLEGWKLFIINKEFLIGDMPLIFYNQKPTLENIFDRVIFPLSKNKLLLLNRNKPEFIDDITINNINLSIFKVSERFIGSGNKELLDYYIDIYKNFSSDEKFKDTVECTFGYIDYLSKFKDVEHYLFNRKMNWGI
jgi:hypothetical protein